MGTLAAPGFYADSTSPVVSATQSFTGKTLVVPLYSHTFRAYAAELGLGTESVRPMPGQTRLAGGFGSRRGRRFANQVTL